MIQVEENYMGGARHFPDQRPIFGPTPANEKYVDEFLYEYFQDLENARPTMPEFVYHALKNCVDETAWSRKYQNKESFDSRRVQDLAKIDHELVQGYYMGTNSFTDALRLMEQAQMTSGEGKRYTPKPHLRDAYYPEMRQEARDEILAYDQNAQLHSAEISKHRPFAVYNIQPGKLAIDGFGDYIRLNHGFADSGRTLPVREKSHVVIRLDSASPIHDLPVLKHEKLGEELAGAFTEAAFSSQEVWDKALIGHAEAVIEDGDSYTTETSDTPIISASEFAAHESRIAFLDTYLAKSPMLRDMIEAALMDEYSELPRWIVPITTQLYAHRRTPQSQN